MNLEPKKKGIFYSVDGKVGQGFFRKKGRNFLKGYETRFEES